MSIQSSQKEKDSKSDNGMVRGLQNRHVQLIAIAGTIGTGLFLGAGRSDGPIYHPCLPPDRSVHVSHDACYWGDALHGP